MAAGTGKEREKYYLFVIFFNTCQEKNLYIFSSVKRKFTIKEATTMIYNNIGLRADEEDDDWGKDDVDTDEE